jgi:hypothetical protein
MVGMLSACLGAIAEEQAAAVEDVCRANATAIADAVSEVAAMRDAAAEVRTALVGAAGGMATAGGALVSNATDAGQLAEVRCNLAAAAAAVTAGQAVLQQCLQAGQLVQEGQLYAALCLLDKVRRRSLGEWMCVACSCSAHAQWCVCVVVPGCARKWPCKERA